MNNPIERGDLPTKEKVLTKEQLNQIADKLITDCLNNLNMLEEFNAAKKPDYPGDISIRGVIFNKEESQYRVNYGESLNWIALAMEKWLDVDKRIQEANGDIKTYSIRVVSRTPLRKFVPGCPEVTYLSSIHRPGELPMPPVIREKRRNTSLALQKATEMLTEFSRKK